ncbi:MAG: PAS domain S-box protein [Chloroflexota bacterium]|nr:MAG: PAS domain S-box protein [Chloroflexota bacterium]
MKKAVKQTKSRMYGSAELAQALIRCAGTGIYIVQDGRFHYVNSLFQELTGYTEKELLDVYSLDLVHPDDREVVRKKAIESLKSGRSLPCEYRFMKKGGEVMWVLERLTSTEYKGKRATVGSFMDITERKQSEETLAKSEERYRTIMDETRDDYYETDLAGHYTFVNDAFCYSAGYDREEIIGKSYKLIHPNEDVERIYETFSQVYLTGQPIKGFVTKFVHKDKSTRVSEQSAFPMRNEKGEIVGFRGVSHDVTERVRMEEALRRSEERYRTMIEEIEEGYYEVDIAGSFTFVNKAACRQFGRSREELIGLNYRDYVPKEDVKSIYKAWNGVFRTGEPVQAFPFTAIRKDGTQIFLENSISPLRNKAGKIVGFRSVSRDVTERKHFEQKLANMATHDSLTGLPNRTLLSDRLAMGLALSRRSGNRMAVMMLDLDNFKVVNDTMGHGVGDQLLKSVGERLTSVTRRSDTVARMGGDEFVLVLPQIAQPTNAAKLAQRVLEVFREPFIFNGHRLNITTSVGIAVYPDDGKEVEELLKNADAAMYWAKEQGRDAYKFYGSDESRAYDKAQINV